MPSIQDVADQINARLDQINTHTENTAQNTADTHDVAKDIRSELQQVNNRLTQIDQTLDHGFANLSQGIFALIQLQIVSIHLLDHHRKQNDTIICELVNNNQLLCDIKRKLAHQLRLDQQTLTSTLKIEGIMTRVHCCEAGDYDRELELKQRLEKCCPPERQPEEKCPEPCGRPGFDPRQPEGLDWRPLPSPVDPKPEG
ncbi:hypothetical protein [Allohahella sp. A8]|uniref:hypothetical protein n=1 Tax=Allohahella sp. A8 TaxID=3141461 RepID=UPI003A7FE04B